MMDFQLRCKSNSLVSNLLKSTSQSQAPSSTKRIAHSFNKTALFPGYYAPATLRQVQHQPYDEPRRNETVPKILVYRIFPEAQYIIWIDGKMELFVDPLLMLKRYLWRGKLHKKSMCFITSYASSTLLIDPKCLYKSFLYVPLPQPLFTSSRKMKKQES